MANTLYDKGKEELLAGNIDLPADEIRAGLVAVSSTDNPTNRIYGVRIFDPADEDPVAGEQIAVTPGAPPSGRGVFMPGWLFGVPITRTAPIIHTCAAARKWGT